ncbi:MAG: type II toxin-antitoxin system RelE/ParE family toxin [Gammaproteobacteria bacterium]|nr:type II toxin-antitoxin system RelE/ParE family toxin [Gammaproteobacteria bacterium]
MAWKIEYTDTAKSQLKKLDKPIAKRILDYMDEVSLLVEPHHRGKGLTGKLGDLWRFRVGDYRVVCQIEDGCLRILILKIGHRKDVYR